MNDKETIGLLSESIDGYSERIEQLKEINDTLILENTALRAEMYLLEKGIEQLQKENEESFRKGFWAGYEDSRCFPDESNIRARYEALISTKEDR